MRVLVVIPGLDGGGGAERSLVATAAHSDSMDLELEVVLLYPRRRLVPVLESRGIPVHDLADDRRSVQLRRIRRLVRDLEPDLVHAILFDAVVMAHLAVVGRSTPLLVTWANTPVTAVEGRSGVAGRGKHWAVDGLERLLGRRHATHFHAVTKGVGRLQADRLRIEAHRVHVGERGRHPHPDDAGSLPAAELRRELGIPLDAQVVVAVGRQERQKGYRTLLQAFDRLADHDPTAWLVVAGREGADTSRLSAQRAGMDHADRVRFLGQRDDVPVVLAMADVVACTSWREGAAGALIEAMASETPIVSVPVSGLDGVLDDGVNAVVVELEDLEQGLRLVLGDPGLARRLARAGRQTYEDRFTVERSRDRMLEIYRTVARR